MQQFFLLWNHYCIWCCTYHWIQSKLITRHGNSDLRNSVLPRNSTLYSVISYRINFGWIIIRHFYFDLISMEVRNISDFDLNFDGHSWTWIEAMKGFQEQMVSALAFKQDHLLKLWNMNLYYYRHYWLTISIFMFQNTFKSAVHVLFSSSSGFKS